MRSQLLRMQWPQRRRVSQLRLSSHSQLALYQLCVSRLIIPHRVSRSLLLQSLHHQQLHLLLFSYSLPELLREHGLVLECYELRMC